MKYLELRGVMGARGNLIFWGFYGRRYQEPETSLEIYCIHCHFLYPTNYVLNVHFIYIYSTHFLQSDKSQKNQLEFK